MAPARNSSPKRTTRSSTRSQTLQSRDDVIAKQRPVTTKGPRRINKHRTKDTDKAKRAAAEPQSETKTDPARQGDNEAAGEDDASTSTSGNVTIFTITSDLVKKPIICHQYASTTSLDGDKTPFIFTHGAGGTLSTPTVVNFSTGFSSTSDTLLLAFQGSMNVGARIKAFHACYSHTDNDVNHPILFGGRSMGARAAVIAATEHLAQQDAQRGPEDSVRAKLVLVSYPLQGPKDVRDQILVDLPEGVDVLFVTGERDAMCPLDLLEKTRGRMRGRSRVVVVKGADHGMDVRPKGRTSEVGEETGRMAVRWLKGEIGVEGEVVYVGEEE